MFRVARSQGNRAGVAALGERRDRDDRSAPRFDMTAQVGERAAQTDMIVNQHGARIRIRPVVSGRFFSMNRQMPWLICHGRQRNVRE